MFLVCPNYWVRFERLRGLLNRCGIITMVSVTTKACTSVFHFKRTAFKGYSTDKAGCSINEFKAPSRSMAKGRMYSYIQA
jgi:hypothetical protein